MKKVLVTGGSGFIGGYVVENLVKRGMEVTVIDRNPKLSTGKYPAGVNVYYGDVRDEGAILEAVMQNDGVIHLAAMLGTQETIDNPTPVAEVNVLGSLNVFKAVVQYKRRAVYIAVGNHWMNNPYSIGKTTAERFAMMYNLYRDGKIAVVRGLNVFGPRQKNAPVRKMMPNLIVNALLGEDVIVYGDGNQIMDWIYAEDVAEVLVRALVNDHKVYDRCFEAGLCQPTTINYLVDKVLAMTKSKSNKLYKPMRSGEQPNSVVKADLKTCNLEHLAYTPDKMTSLEKGLEATIKYYRENLDKYKVNTLFA